MVPRFYSKSAPKGVKFAQSNGLTTVPLGLQRILIEEAAESELEALMIAAMQHVIPAWLRKVGRPNAPVTKVSPVVDL